MNQQGLSELWEIKQQERETTWNLMRRFKDASGKISYLIDPNHQRDWFIKALLLLTRTPLTQQKIDTLQDALEQAMKIEAMVGYPQEFRWGGAVQDPSIVEIQHQIGNLTKNLKDNQLVRPARFNVWFKHCLMEGHIATKFLRLRASNVGTLVTRTQGAPPFGGVGQINTQGLCQPQPHFLGFLT